MVLEGDAELSPVTERSGDPTSVELRELYRSLSGEHPDWDEYDTAMIEQGRQVVRIRPTHAYGIVRD